MLRAVGVPSPLVIPKPASGTAVTIGDSSTAATNASLGAVNIATNLNYDAGDAEIYTSGTVILNIAAFGALKLRAGNALAVTFASATQNATFAKAVGVNNVAPPAQVTGFGTPTGTGVVNNFSGSAATLAQCSQAIAQLITDLKNFGIYAA